MNIKNHRCLNYVILNERVARVKNLILEILRPACGGAQNDGREFISKNRITALFFICFIFLNIASGYCAEEESPLFWPPPPAQMRISFVKSIYSAQDIGSGAGVFKKLKRAIVGEEKDILNKPVSVALDSKKTIYVCDAGVPALHIFMQKEKRYKRITQINKEALLSPVGVALSDKGLVFVADSKLRKVFCLDKDHRFKFALGQDARFLRPTGLAIVKDRLYVVDTLAHNISVFDLSGNFILQFGRRGKAGGQFNYPTSIAADGAGKIYIADTLNFRVQVFDKNNKFLYSIGQAGDASGSFSRPKGVAVDSYGHIYTTDAMFDNIQIFSPKGEFLLSLGESGQRDGEFWIPSGLAVDNDDYIYAVDSYNQRLQVFHYVGKD